MKRKQLECNQLEFEVICLKDPFNCGAQMEGNKESKEKNENIELTFERSGLEIQF